MRREADIIHTYLHEGQVWAEAYFYAGDKSQQFVGVYRESGEPARCWDASPRRKPRVRYRWVPRVGDYVVTRSRKRGGYNDDKLIITRYDVATIDELVTLRGGEDWVVYHQETQSRHPSWTAQKWAPGQGVGAQAFTPEEIEAEWKKTPVTRNGIQTGVRHEYGDLLRFALPDGSWSRSKPAQARFVLRAGQAVGGETLRQALSALHEEYGPEKYVRANTPERELVRELITACEPEEWPACALEAISKVCPKGQGRPRDWDRVERQLQWGR